MSSAAQQSGQSSGRQDSAAQQPDSGADEEQGYSVTVRCTECGADAEVGVLQHMAQCSFCSSKHLVVGQEEVLQLALPERCADADALTQAILDHYRYQYYLKLYRRSVAPLERNTAAVTADGRTLSRPEIVAAVEAAEARVSRQADAYREKISAQVRLLEQLHFLVPYRHGMGTMYQAAFGRCRRSQEKQLHFAITTLETSTCATEILEFPDMGRLSYLKALRPVAQYGDEVKALPCERGVESLQRSYGDLNRKQLVRDIAAIKLGSAFTQHVSAVVWRPYWAAKVEGPSGTQRLLVDSATGSVVGTAGYINPEVFAQLPPAALETGRGLRFLPMECPTCGHEFPFEVDAALHFCSNCHRVCGVSDGGKYNVSYGHVPEPPNAEYDLVPFWCFALQLRTGDGKLVTDMMHLKDGIDGTLDQIGEDAVQTQHGYFVPAIRCINSRLMAQAFRRLFLFSVQHPLRPVWERFPLDVKPRPWDVSLEEEEARRLAPLYLSMAFTKRDIARVNVHQVATWLFNGTQESQGRLVYVPVPCQLTRPFRDYLGRFRGQALQKASSAQLG